jgi:hypothetical protein
MIPARCQAQIDWSDCTSSAACSQPAERAITVPESNRFYAGMSALRSITLSGTDRDLARSVLRPGVCLFSFSCVFCLCQVCHGKTSGVVHHRIRATHTCPLQAGRGDVSYSCVVPAALRCLPGASSSFSWKR